jgi:hypothetical protein
MRITVRFHGAIRRSAVLGMLLSLASACAESPANSVQRRDSAGIRIIETPGAIARAPIWSVSEGPDLQLGSVTDTGPHMFDGIGGLSGGIAGLPGGHIVVVDGTSGELRFFDNQGRFLNRAGGLGSGPGEFRLPKLIRYAARDSVLVFDRRQRRFTLFSSDGRAHRDFPPHPVSRALLVGNPQGASNHGILVMIGLSPLNMNEGQHESTIGVRWITLDSTREKIVAQYSNPSYVTTFDVPYGLPVPFNARPSVTIGHGGFFIVGGHAADVRQYDNKGQLVRIFRVIEAPRRVTAEDINTAIDYAVSNFTIPQDPVRAAYKRMDFPDHWPTFQSVHVDQVGWIWAELYRPVTTEASRWMVFDTTGVAGGTVELPAELEVHDIAADYVLGRWRDSMRVEYVRRYRLGRSR